MCNTRTRNEKKKEKNKENFHCLRKNARDEDRCRVRILNENLNNYYFITNLMNQILF